MELSEKRGKHGIDDLGCVRCDEIVCLDLNKESQDSIDAGNELYVYSHLAVKVSNNLDLRIHVCVNGRILMSLCLITVPLYHNRMENFLAPVLMQIIRDLKASLFLAFSGHYRSSLQILRCSFEHLIAGVNFQSERIKLEEKHGSIENLRDRYNSWMSDTSRIRYTPLIGKFYKVGFLSIDQCEDWRKFYAYLSRFVHTPEEFIAKVKHHGADKIKGEIACPSMTYFNEVQLIEWSNAYQHLFYYVMKTIVKFHPELLKTESGKLAVDILNSHLYYWKEKAPDFKNILLLLNHQ